MSRHVFLSVIGAALIFKAHAEEPLNLEVRFDQSRGALRALHGINKGPFAGGGLVDLIEAQRALHIPWTRLHDCHFPNPDVVDMHAVFPRAEADPALESSYDFARTDRYLEGVRATGAGIVYRLGESIEHEPVKKWVHPPRDPARWAQTCLGIIRHYNEGWASGFHHNIRYWEIWNEPENRPVMWTGTDEQFFALYRTAARAIKEKFPALKVGGPSIGGPGNFVNGQFQPSSFLTKFLDTCRRESVPLDFFSWHCYTDNPRELSARARAIRSLLDERGFAKTESHLNEWNYLPGNSWRPLSPKTPAIEKQRAYEKMSGPQGAAFIAAAFIELQDAPVDIANLFHGEAGAFGLFTEEGVPTANYSGLLAFAQLMESPRRLAVTPTNQLGVFVAAGLSGDGERANVLIANTGPSPKVIQLVARGVDWNKSRCEIRRFSSVQWPESIEGHSLIGPALEVSVEAPVPGVLLIAFSREAK